MAARTPLSEGPRSLRGEVHAPRTPSTPAEAPYIGAWRAYYKALIEAGAYVDGAPLRDVTTASKVQRTRAGEPPMIYAWLDLVPKERDKDELAFTMAWVRHHDRYGTISSSIHRPYRPPVDAVTSCAE